MTARTDHNLPVRQQPAASPEELDVSLAVPLPGEPCFPLAPLLVAAKVGTRTELASRYGLSGRTVREWALRGLPMGVADRFAILRVGVMPEEVWDDWLLAGLDFDPPKMGAA